MFKSIYIKIEQFFDIVVFGLLNNKLRSFLTMLGVIIGVASIIMVMSIGSGAQGLILNQVKSIGANVIGVFPGKAEKNAPPASVMGITITTLTYNDLVAIKDKRNVPGVIDVVGYSKGVSTVSWRNRNIDTNISGTTTGYIKVENSEVVSGRFFTQSEEKNLARVAVLGYDVKKELFGNSDAVGKKIKIKKLSFEVIGVMGERGTVAFQDYDNQILVPISTMQKMILGVNHLGLIRVKVNKNSNMDNVKSDIEHTLRNKHDIFDNSGDSDDFTVRSSDEALDLIGVITDSLKIFLVAMAALSLIVGGIGIMNIMLISVNERTGEIGLRKSVGANNRDILYQFLAEAVFITLIGGIIGVVFGVIISYLISLAMNVAGYDWVFVISPLSITMGIIVSVFVGIIFGLYPAKKATNLSPIEALRYE